MHEGKNLSDMGIYLHCIFGGQGGHWLHAGLFYVHHFGQTRLTHFAQRSLLSLLKMK